MSDFDIQLAIAALGVWGIACLLRLVAECIRHLTSLHDLKVRVAELRRERLVRFGPVEAAEQPSAVEEPHRAAA